MRLHRLAFAQTTCLAAAALLGCAPSAQAPTDASDPLPLPFPASYYFAPTGAYGDAELPSSVTVDLTCATRAPAPEGSEGDCYTVDYTTPVGGYAGVFWQFPPNNWGAEQGRRVSPGATRVTFSARADGASPVPVTFGVGGIGTGSTTALAFHDTIDSSDPVMLGNDWQTYSIPITGSYEWVLGGFSWEASTQTPIAFYIDDIQWQ